MPNSPRKVDPMAILPYAIGLFMLLPYGLAFILWLFVFPGAGNGFESALSTTMFAVTVPLVFWFFFCSLGFIANSMAGDDEFDAPRQVVIAHIVRLLPLATLCIGAAGVLYLLSLGKPWYEVLAPAVLAVAIDLAIVRGERARGADKLIARQRGRIGRPAAGAVSLSPSSARTTVRGLIVLAAGLLGLLWGTVEPDQPLMLLSLAVGCCAIVALFVLLSGERRPGV